MKNRFNQAITTTTLTSLVILSVLASTTAQAKRNGERKLSDNRIVKQFSKLDANQDDMLQFDELSDSALIKSEAHFTKKDTNADGFISFEEITAGKDLHDYSDIAEEISQCVADIKTESGNELIQVPDPANYQTAQQKFSQADLNGDELLDLAEMQTQKLDNLQGRFEIADDDADNQLSLAEFSQAKLARFATRQAIKTCVDELTEEDEI